MLHCLSFAFCRVTLIDVLLLQLKQLCNCLDASHRTRLENLCNAAWTKSYITLTNVVQSYNRSIQGVGPACVYKNDFAILSDAAQVGSESLLGYICLFRQRIGKVAIGNAWAMGIYAMLRTAWHCLIASGVARKTGI